MLGNSAEKGWWLLIVLDIVSIFFHISKYRNFDTSYYSIDFFHISKYRKIGLSMYQYIERIEISNFRCIEIPEFRYIERTEISKFRCIYTSNVSCSPSPGIPVLFAQILNESFHVPAIKYRNRIDPYAGCFVYRYRIELDSDIDKITDIQHWLWPLSEEHVEDWTEEMWRLWRGSQITLQVAWLDRYTLDRAGMVDFEFRRWTRTQRMLNATTPDRNVSISWYWYF